jgi:hypothetical protein
MNEQLIVETLKNLSTKELLIADKNASLLYPKYTGEGKSTVWWREYNRQKSIIANQKLQRGDKEST